jgi:mRNA interferase MazF
VKIYNQGDIVAVPFPFSDLSSQKLRPCLVISNKNLKKTDEIFVLAITGRIYKDAYGVTITNESVEYQLPKEPSQIRLNHIFSVNQGLITD